MKLCSEEENLSQQNIRFQSISSFRCLDIQIGLNHYQMRMCCYSHWIHFTNKKIKELRSRCTAKYGIFAPVLFINLREHTKYKKY